MSGVTATGSRRLDLVCAAVLFLVVTASARHLRVYHTVTPYRITVYAVAADGSRARLATPPSLRAIRSGIAHAEARIRTFHASPAGRALRARHPRLEWVVQYGIDSIAFDRRHVVAPGA